MNTWTAGKALLKHHCQFVLLLGKGIYPCEYMDSWKSFAETSLPNKKVFYSELYLCSKRYTIAGRYVFENFRNECIEIYELDPAKFLSAPGLAWQAFFKKAGVELELLTDIDMLLIVEKGIRDGICHAIDRNARANNKYMKNTT